MCFVVVDFLCFVLACGMVCHSVYLIQWTTVDILICLGNLKLFDLFLLLRKTLWNTFEVLYKYTRRLDRVNNWQVA